MTNPRHWELSAQNPHARCVIQQSDRKEFVWHCPLLISGVGSTIYPSSLRSLTLKASPAPEWLREQRKMMSRRFTAACYRQQQKSQASKCLSKTTHLAGNSFFPAGFPTGITLFTPKSASHTDMGKPLKSLGLHCLCHLQPRLSQSAMLPLGPLFLLPQEGNPYRSPHRDSHLPPSTSYPPNVKHRWIKPNSFFRLLEGHREPYEMCFILLELRASLVLHPACQREESRSNLLKETLLGQSDI